MRCKLLACEVMRNEIEAVCAGLGVTPADYDAEWFSMQLHRHPENLHDELARRVDALRGTSYDAVLLSFGLCSNSTAGLRAPGIPLVIPKMHDCVTLFLGSREKYREEHEREPGTFWFSRGFLQQEDDLAADDLDFDPFAAPTPAPGEEGKPPGPGGGLPDGFFLEARREALLRRWTEQYGEDSAEYLVELVLDSWKKNYTRTVLIDNPDDPERDGHRARVTAYAAANGWRFEELPINLRLLRGLLDGGWQSSPEYLVTPPDAVVKPTHDDEVVGWTR